MQSRSFPRVRRPLGSELRFLTTPRAYDDRVDFDGAFGAQQQRFSISVDTLHALADGAPARQGPLQLFDAHRATILGVASRVFQAGVHGDPIELRPALFRSH